ncbi:hypothetical protein HBB16_19795 [Pseudonocardia sp. MCCB 268]|nr:hypothetical protein [Pseudonocardia cytotoxica]
MGTGATALQIVPAIADRARRRWSSSGPRSGSCRTATTCGTCRRRPAADGAGAPTTPRSTACGWCGSSRTEAVDDTAPGSGWPHPRAGVNAATTAIRAFITRAMESSSAGRRPAARRPRLPAVQQADPDGQRVDPDPPAGTTSARPGAGDRARRSTCSPPAATHQNWTWSCSRPGSVPWDARDAGVTGRDRTTLRETLGRRRRRRLPPASPCRTSRTCSSSAARRRLPARRQRSLRAECTANYLVR